jgi:hypothetical protein
LPEPFSFIFTWFAALPLIFWIAQAITNAIVKDFLILKVFYFVSCNIIVWLTGEHTDDYCSFFRAHVQIVEMKTFPSSGLYCQFLVVVQKTLWNVQSMPSIVKMEWCLCFEFIFWQVFIAMLVHQLRHWVGVWFRIAVDYTPRTGRGIRWLRFRWVTLLRAFNVIQSTMLLTWQLYGYFFKNQTYYGKQLKCWESL